jgi:hypothetical protein
MDAKVLESVAEHSNRETKYGTTKNGLAFAGEKRVHALSKIDTAPIIFCLAF